MLTTKEKRFIQYWQDQRKGGIVTYHILYILLGTFIASLVITFLIVVTSLEIPRKVWLIPATGFVIISVMTTLSWSTNEKRFKALIKREVREGKLMDDKSDDEKLV